MPRRSMRLGREWRGRQRLYRVDTPDLYLRYRVAETAASSDCSDITVVTIIMQ
jgi:hypothetical protein